MSQTQDIPVEVKRNLLQNNIQALKNTIYNLEVQVRVGKKVGDSQMASNATADMEKTLKLLDAYETELKEVG